MSDSLIESCHTPWLSHVAHIVVTSRSHTGAGVISRTCMSHVTHTSLHQEPSETERDREKERERTYAHARARNRQMDNESVRARDFVFERDTERARTRERARALAQVRECEG